MASMAPNLPGAGGGEVCSGDSWVTSDLGHAIQGLIYYDCEDF